MDDFLGSLFYIIITVIVVAVSLLGKKKKKVFPGVPHEFKEDREVEEKPRFFTNLEQLLNQELGIENNVPKYPFEKPKEYEQEFEEEKEEILDKVPEKTIDDKLDTLSSIEYENTDEISKDSIAQSEIKGVSDIEEDSTIEEFNLQDAIIYSEILNRKEY